MKFVRQLARFLLILFVALVFSLMEMIFVLALEWPTRIWWWLTDVWDEAKRQWQYAGKESA